MIARRIKPILLAAAATAALGVRASAAPLAPGGFYFPGAPITSTVDPGTLVNSISGTFTTPGGEHGTYHQNVINVLGNLEFDTVVTDDLNSPGNLEALSFFNFGGFTTDVGYDPANSTTMQGPTFPASWFRSASGDTISVDFHPPVGTQIAPGQQTDIIIKTNASNYTTGVLGVIDGGTSNMTIYAPTSAVPEPGSLALLATGGLPLLGFLRRRKLA